MKRARVVHPQGLTSVSEWRQRLRGAEVVAVISPEHEHLLGVLVAQLGEGALISATKPVTEALKVVVGGLIVASVDRDEMVQLVEPFAFQADLARSVLAPLEEEEHVDLLGLLGRATTPLRFHFDSGGS